MLARMYQRYGERKNLKTKIIDASYGESGGPEGRVGVKKIVLEVKGKYAFGLIKRESGTHRLVRKSPFSSGGTRHTSFAQVDVFPLIKESNREIKIKDEDLKFDTFKASGPGGQNVNKRESAVRVTHIPSGIVVSSQSERKQGENRRIALSILQSKLEKIKEEEAKKKREREKQEVSGTSWGTQIRNYVLHPYKLIKDLQNKTETSNVEDVLDGNLDLL
jgi:peptide chain release factor 2